MSFTQFESLSSSSLGEGLKLVRLASFESAEDLEPLRGDEDHQKLDEEEVFGWFKLMGIVLGNPEDVLNEYLSEKRRKVSQLASAARKAPASGNARRPKNFAVSF